MTGVARGEGGIDLNSGAHPHGRLPSQDVLDGLAGLAAREAYANTDLVDMAPTNPVPVEKSSMSPHSSLGNSALGGLVKVRSSITLGAQSLTEYGASSGLVVVRNPGRVQPPKARLRGGIRRVRDPKEGRIN